jgi:hypothetical protein
MARILKRGLLHESLTEPGARARVVQLPPRSRWYHEGEDVTQQGLAASAVGLTVGGSSSRGSAIRRSGSKTW